MALNWDRARKQALEIDNKYNTVRSVTPEATSRTAYVPGTTKYTAAANITPKRTVTTLPNVSTPTADRARLGLVSGWNPASSSLSRFTRERENEAMARTGSEAEALKLKLDTLSAQKAALEERLTERRAAEQPSEVARESLMRTAYGWSQRQELEEPERGSDRVSARIEALDQEYNSLLPQYYAAKNEATLRRMEGDGALKSLYAQAKGLREDLDRAALAQTGGGAAGAQGDGGAAGAAWTDLQKKYGVSRAAELPALHERLLREFDALEEQLAAQGVDYEYLRAYEQMAEDRAAWVEKQAETEAYAREHPVMASVESVLKSPMQGLDLLSLGTPGAGRNDPDSPDTYVPLNVYGMDVSNFVNTVRGTVSEEIEQNTDWELFGQNVASFLYQTGMSVADSAAQVALFGPGATYLMGASAAANQAREVIERGGTNRQALLSGLAAGAAEALFEKVSVERLLSERSVRSMRDLLAETLKQAGTEASEEMLTEVSNLLSDAAIMGSGSSFAAMVDRYETQGLNGDEAKRRAFLDCLSQVALAGVGGALSGGVMGGTVRGANYLSGAWNQVQSARASRPTNAALLDSLNQHLSQPGQVESDLRPLPFRSELENRAVQTLPMADTRPVTTLPNPSASQTVQSENAAPWAAVDATGQNNTASTGEAGVSVVPGPSAINERNRANNTLAYTLAINVGKIRDMNPVTKLTGLEMSDKSKKPSEQISEFFRSIGNKVFRNGLGDVSLGKYGIGSMLNHRPLNRAKMVSLAAVPDVIKNGRQINYDPDWKGRGYPSYIFAAPVKVGASDVFVAAVVNQLPDNRFYLSEMVDSEGNYVRIEESPSSNSKYGVTDGAVTGEDGVTARPEGLSKEANLSAPNKGAAPTLPLSAPIIADSSAGGNTQSAPNGPESSVGAAQRGFDRWSSFQGTRSQFFPEGANAARPVDVPTTDPQGRPVRRTASTAMGAKAIPDDAISDIQNMVLRGELSYGRVTDEASVRRAVKTIEDKGYQGALEEFRSSVSKGVVSKDIATLGQQLLINAANAGDSKATAEILNLYAQMETAAGQAVQAASILRKLSPSDQLYAAQRDVIELEKTLQKKYKDLELTIDPALIEAFQQQTTQEGRDQVLDKIYQNVADQVPATWKDKWNAWRYLAMLANPRTHVRNVVGNVGFQPLRMAKDRVAAAIEAGVSRASGGKLQRTKSFAVNPELFRAAWGDWANVKETLSGSKYNDVKSQIESRRRVFTLPVLEGMRKGNSSLLELEDAIFKRITYADALAGYLQANGVTADQIRDNTVDAQLMVKARDYAGQEALRATYQDRNAFSDKVVQVANVLGPFGEAVLPFKRTPANILVRGFEYSPAGLSKALTADLYQVKQGNMTGAEAIDHIAAGLTGSGLFALGAYLFAQGIVTSGGGDDEKQDEINDLTGGQNYALNLPGGGSITLDWLAPEALPFFMGVELMDSMGQNGFTAESIMDSLSSISEPMLELSMLQSLNDLIDSVSYAASSQKIQGLVESALISYFTQAVPTLLGQLERTGEDKRMSTYTDQNKTLPTNIQYALGRASARIPGWDYQQIPYIDAWGREEKTGTLPMRAFNNFLNPAYTSSMNVTPVDEEIQRLYNATGNGAVVPSRPNRYITVDKTRINLSKEQYVQYATERGQTQFSILEDLLDSPAYAGLSDEEKAAVVDDVYTYADAMAKAGISDYEPEDWMLNVQNAKRDLGVSPAEYIMLHSKYGGGLTEGDKVREAYQAGIPARSYLEYAAKKKDTDGSGGVSTRELVAAIENSGLPRSQKTELFFVEKPEWKEQAEEHGIDGDLFIQFKIATDGIAGDKDRDGKTIPNSKKKKVMDAINRLEISKEEKDALYYAAGYSASTIRDAPWR